MAGFLTDYSNNRVLDLFYGRVAYTSPAILYIGLSTSSANKAGYVVEPTGGSYARVTVPNDLTRFPVAVAGSKANGVPFTFPAPSASWGSIVSVFVSDALTGGNILAMADLPTPRAIAGGDQAPAIAAGALFLSHT